jgi:hypothetical protein
MGLRGITYAFYATDSSRIRLDYQLLGNQIRYGAIGIYAPMSVELGLLSDDLSPTALGVGLAESFPSNAEVEEAVVKNLTSIPRETLEEWGKKVRIDRISRREREWLKMALLSEKHRSFALEAISSTYDTQGELQRLRNIKERFEHNQVVPAANDRILLLDAIDSFERFYLVSDYAFERMRWLASHSPSRTFNLSEGDDKLDKVLPNAVERGKKMIQDLIRLNEVVSVAKQCKSPIDLAKKTIELKGSAGWCRTLTEHHLEVQRGKFEDMLPKAPWIEIKGDVIMIGANRYLLNVPPSSMIDMTPHPYKTSAADNYIRAAGIDR